MLSLDSHRDEAVTELVVPSPDSRGDNAVIAIVTFQEALEASGGYGKGLVRCSAAVSKLLGNEHLLKALARLRGVHAATAGDASAALMHGACGASYTPPPSWRRHSAERFRRRCLGETKK